MNRDGIAYHGTLTLRSAEVLFDQYIAGPLHISPGFMFYNGNEGNANASVPGGQTFTLGGATYVSQPGNPIAGTGSIEARSGRRCISPAARVIPFTASAWMPPPTPCFGINNTLTAFRWYPVLSLTFGYRF